MNSPRLASQTAVQCQHVPLGIEKHDAVVMRVGDRQPAVAKLADFFGFARPNSRASTIAGAVCRRDRKPARARRCRARRFLLEPDMHGPRGGDFRPFGRHRPARDAADCRVCGSAASPCSRRTTAIATRAAAGHHLERRRAARSAGRLPRDGEKPAVVCPELSSRSSVSPTLPENAADCTTSGLDSAGVTPTSSGR